MCADNNGCPMDVFVNGAGEGVGGTSLSSPMSAGLWARLETHYNNTLGFAAPVYYGVYGYYEPCPLGLPLARQQASRATTRPPYRRTRPLRSAVSTTSFSGPTELVPRRRDGIHQQVLAPLTTS